MQQNTSGDEAAFSHFDQTGQARMVDVSAKPDTRREAVAAGTISMTSTCFDMVTEGRATKGDVLAVARLAGIMAAKKTPDLIPLAHPIPLSSVTIDFAIDRETSRITIQAKVLSTGKTGVEMEALTAVAMTALTIYDMCKSVDKSMLIGDIRLLNKRGGKSGTYHRKE